jgi:hypothetical protein
MTIRKRAKERRIFMKLPGVGGSGQSHGDGRIAVGHKINN